VRVGGSQTLIGASVLNSDIDWTLLTPSAPHNKLRFSYQLTIITVAALGSSRSLYKRGASAQTFRATATYWRRFSSGPLQYMYQGSRVLYPDHSVQLYLSWLPNNCFHYHSHFCPNTLHNLHWSSIWSVALYESEAWNLAENEERVINAFQTWCWRRTLKIKWTDRITNDEVFQRVKEERLLLKS
jgi:hypothetical protein